MKTDLSKFPEEKKAALSQASLLANGGHPIDDFMDEVLDAAQRHQERKQKASAQQSRSE